MREALTALLIGLGATAAEAQESLSIASVAAIKDATVMIATTDPGDPGSGMSGSGFLFRVDGQTGYIATNDHVISPPKGLFNNPAPSGLCSGAGPTPSERCPRRS